MLSADVKRHPGGPLGGVQETAFTTNVGSTLPAPGPSSLAPAMSQVALRILQETMAAALPFTWLRRAQQLEWARPKHGEFRGGATGADLARRDERLADEAETCRERARFCVAYSSDIFEMFRDDVLMLMGEERIFLEREAPQVVRAGKDLVREAQDVINLLQGVVFDGDQP